MANLKEQEKWEDGVYQIEENDPVLGGENGITNKPAKQLANRTLWLKKVLEAFGKKSAPKDLTADSTSTADESGHSHKLPLGSTTQKGLWQATSDTGVDSENLVLTARAGKKLAQQTAQLQQNVERNYINNSKKSSAVNSNSNDTVATSSAVKSAYDKATNAQSTADNAQASANSANNNANGRVSKAGDSLTGILRAVGIASTQFGFGAYSQQYTSGAPYMVEATGSKDRDTYHPFIKGLVRSKNHYGAAFSFGYTTKQGSGDGFGQGVINLTEDNGKTINWGFAHNGDFNSAGDVRSSSGKSINHSVQTSELVGEVAFFARSTPPSGWLKANGAAVSRTTYAALFSAIGTTFGAGDGRTTFNLPDSRGEFIRGLDDGRNVDGGRRLGSAQGDALKSHYHGVGSGSGNDGYFLQGGFNENQISNEKFFNLPGEGGWGGANYKFEDYKKYPIKFKTTNNNDVSGETRPRNIALLACIKY